MKMEVPLPLPNTPHFSKPTQSALPSISRQNATSSPLDASMSHHLISDQIPYKTRPFNHSLSVSTDKKCVQDSSIMATSMSEVKGWRNRRCIHIDFVLGCREGSDAAEEVRGNFCVCVCVCMYIYMCVCLVFVCVCVCLDGWIDGWLRGLLADCIFKHFLQRLLSSHFRANSHPNVTFLLSLTKAFMYLIRELNNLF